MCRYTSAGHPPPLVAIPGRSCRAARGRPRASARARASHAAVPAGAWSTSRPEASSSSTRTASSSVVASRSTTGSSSSSRRRARGRRDAEQLLEHILERFMQGAASGRTTSRSSPRASSRSRRGRSTSASRARWAPSTSCVTRCVLARRRRTSAGRGGGDRPRRLGGLRERDRARPGPGKDLVRLTATLADSRVRVVVEDSGRWSPEEDRPDRGLGLHLMRTLMSSVEIETGGEGTRVTLERSARRRRSLDPAAAEAGNAREFAPTCEQPEPTLRGHRHAAAKRPPSGICAQPGRRQPIPVAARQTRGARSGAGRSG